MAGAPEKSARETSRAKNDAAGAVSPGNGEAGEAKPGEVDSAPELLKTQRQELKTVLAKRSEANADRDSIAKEFAAVWLPHVAVEQDILVPALKNAGIDEDKLADVAIHKDIINWLLADRRISMTRRPGGLSAANVTHHLQGARFPASKSDLLLRARDSGAGQDALELLESFPDDAEFESLADVTRAYEASDQVPQTGIVDVKP